MKSEKKEGLMILMADGNLEDHKKVKKAARECKINHVFTSVYNGSQLLDYLFKKGAYYSSEEVVPDLIIMDLYLDLVNGFEALESIREEEKLKSVPVYVLTKTRQEEDVMRAKNLGVKDYLQKPILEREWQELVGNICTRSLKKTSP